MPTPVEGRVDLSDLAGRGVFAAWNDPAMFSAVSLGPHGAIEWVGGIDLCPGAMYLRLTGQAPEDLSPASEAAESRGAEWRGMEHLREVTVRAGQAVPPPLGRRPGFRRRR